MYNNTKQQLILLKNWINSTDEYLFIKDINGVYQIVSKENAKLLRNGYWVSAETEADYLAENQVRLDELKAASVLIWKAE